jgi:hypothetical protein
VEKILQVVMFVKIWKMLIVNLATREIVKMCAYLFFNGEVAIQSNSRS